MGKNKDNTTHVGPNGRGGADYEEQTQIDFGKAYIEAAEKKMREMEEAKKAQGGKK